MTDVLHVDPCCPSPEVLERAAGLLRAGSLVGFPTETFYGVAAAALDPRAVRRVFEAKGRPGGKPVLVLVDSVAMAETVARDISPAARELMARCWPGAVTLVLRARDAVPVEVTAGTGTVGVRFTGHAVARALVRALGAPITAPSANRSGGVPPVAADAVVAALGEHLALVLDAGPTPGGRPSTLVDASVDPPRVLRAGAVAL